MIPPNLPRSTILALLVGLCGLTASAAPQKDRLAKVKAAATELSAEELAAFDELGFTEIVFAARAPGRDGHWYANFGYYAADPKQRVFGADGGRLAAWNLKTGQTRTILDDPRGAVRDPQVHYDGRRILFSYRKGGGEHYNLYEINADGTGLKQLTDGPWDDIEPIYLPDGGIMFCSSRCRRWVNCWLTQVAVLHRCDSDGRNVRQVSANIEHDNTPWVMPDGRVLHQRWEYIDRSQVDFHHLWTMNPDGTGQMVFYGNQRAGVVMIDAKPIPGTERVLAVFSPGHGRSEHAGPFCVLDSQGGPDDPSRAKLLSQSGRDPYPLTRDLFLYAEGRSIHLGSVRGGARLLWTDPRIDLHEPRPLAARPREPVIPARSDPRQSVGRLLLADVHRGRNMTGVAPGQIKKLLVVESLPKPINYTGGMDPLTYGGSFTLERVWGTVPVESDGSAHFELPALRSFFLVALDENDNSVKRMQSFLTVQPGEVTGCVGCHEDRKQTIALQRDLLASRRRPSAIQPIAGIPDVFDFPRDIQPILDRHCVACHDYQRHPEGKEGPRAGGVILAGDHGPMFSHGYVALTLYRQFADGRNQPRGNRPPRSIGATASPLMAKLQGEHHGVKASRQEVETVRYWIESGAPYPGTYAALGTGSIGGYYQNAQVETDKDWPETRAAGEVLRRRCGDCHQGKLALPRSLCDENGLSFWRPDWNDPRLRRSRHVLFNLSRPDQSLLLLAPLAKAAGGLELCKTESGKPVLADASDPDYAAILAMCAAGKRKLQQIKRFDMPGFRPQPAYIREMQRYGVLRDAGGALTAPDGYLLDRAYWQAIGYQTFGER